MGFVFQHKNAKEKLKAALITTFREKGWSSPLAVLVATTCGALGVQHKPVPDVSTAVLLFQCPCTTPLPTMASGCPQALVHIPVLSWEVAESDYAARKPSKYFLGSMKAWGETKGTAKRTSVSRFIK